MKDWNIEALTGYKPKTTFYSDFSIAEAFGYYAILDTYKRFWKYYKEDYEWLTELVMVLNWKVWEHYKPESENILAKYYNEMYEEAKHYAETHLKDDKLEYFYRTID